MATLDLDAKRAARSEAENAPHELVLGGERFELPPRMPLLFLDRLTQMDFAGAMRQLLGDAWQKFAAQGPEMDDLLAIAEELYGIGDFFGEGSEAFPASSSNGGTPSKPTSKPAMASTSRRAATARTTSVSDGSSPS